MCEISSKLTIGYQNNVIGVFLVNFEHCFDVSIVDFEKVSTGCEVTMKK